MCTPLNKQGCRQKDLALQSPCDWPMGDKKVVASGPIVKAVRRKWQKADSHFFNIGKGINHFRWQRAEVLCYCRQRTRNLYGQKGIDCERIPSSFGMKSVTEPITVRYAWADNPDGANLCNKEMLPASPF